MREKRVGLVGVLDGSFSVTNDGTAGWGIVSSGVRSDVCGGLCFCNAAVGGMSVTCLMNVVMAR